MFTGTKTFAMYWNATTTQLIKTGCYGTFEEGVSPNIVVGNGATAMHREKMIMARKVICQKAPGSICETSVPVYLLIAG